MNVFVVDTAPVCHNKLKVVTAVGDMKIDETLSFLFLKLLAGNSHQFRMDKGVARPSANICLDYRNSYFFTHICTSTGKYFTIIK